MNESLQADEGKKAQQAVNNMQGHGESGELK